MSGVEARTYMICQGCETAVRECNDAPCPACRRCGVCGRKLKEHEEHCGHEPELVARLRASCGFPESELPRERRRVEIRKQLEGRWMLVRLTIVLTIIFGSQVAWRVWIGLDTFGHISLYVVVATSVFVMFDLLCHFSLRRTENRRLATEFPSKTGESDPTSRIG